MPEFQELDFGEEEKKKLSNKQMAVIIILMMIAAAIPVAFAYAGNMDAFAITIAVYIFGAIIAVIIQEWFWPPYKRYLHPHIRKGLWWLFDWLAKKLKS